jgi:hypothetical protein
VLQERSPWTRPSVHCTFNTQSSNHDCTLNTQSSNHDCTFNTQSSYHDCTFNTQSSYHDCTFNTHSNNHDCTFNTQSSNHDCTFNTQSSNHNCTFKTQSSNHDCTFNTHKVVTMLVSYFNFHSLQNRNTLPEHLSSSRFFCGIHVTRSFVLSVCFVDRCLSLCPFSFGICVVCYSSIYGF